MKKIYPLLRRFVVLSALCVILLGVFDRAQAVDLHPITLISKNASGTDTADGQSGMEVAVSEDGNRVVFTSYASNLTNVPIVPYSGYHLYLYDHALGTVTLIDKNAAGTASGDGYGWIGEVAFSLDGSHIVFASDAPDLTATPDSNGVGDVFLYDVEADTVTLISKNVAGTSTANENSTSPSISADGSLIEFTSKATNLTANPDTNTFNDVYLYEVATGTTTLISTAVGSSSAADSASQQALLSADGSAIVFTSYATNLTADTDLNGTSDVFLYNIASDTTTLITNDTSGTATGDYSSTHNDISADGNLIVVLSSATNLTTDTNISGNNLYLYDALTNTLTLITKNYLGTGTGGVSNHSGDIAANGSRVVFSSYSDGYSLTPDPNSYGSRMENVYLYDVQTGTNQLVSINTAGTASGNGQSGDNYPRPLISADGNRIYFKSKASDLTNDADDINSSVDAYLYDALTDSLTLVSRKVSNTGAAGYLSDAMGISADGTTLIIYSKAADLTYDLDTNGHRDVYRVKVGTPPSLPTSLSAAQTSQTQIDLAWSDTSWDETSFRIERSANGMPGSWTEIGTNAANDTTFSNTSLSCNTTYYYRVRAHRSDDNSYSVYSNTLAWSTWTCGVFADVPVVGKAWMQAWVEAFYAAQITGGCGFAPNGQRNYCPEREVTRAEMAVFIIRALHYGNLPYTPTDPDDSFDDVPVATKEWMQPWIEEFYDLGITQGCGVSPLIFCPEQPVTRAEMAVFILRALEGGSYQPPAASGYFDDVPFAGKEWMEAWIDEFYRRGITGGCGVDAESDPIFCPERAVTRAEMAVFILRAFENIPSP